MTERPLPDAWQNAELPGDLPPLGADVIGTFTDTIYGHTPPGGQLTDLVLQSREDGVLDGAADRLRHRAVIACPLGNLELDLLTHLPTGGAPAPVFVVLSFTGIEETLEGEQARRWPYAAIARAGYAVLTVDYRQIEPDDPAATAAGVRALFPTTDGEPWGAVAAWAWGLSRCLDAAGHIEGIDPVTAIAVGHSRLGKAALWAGVQDERFAVTVSNDSGCCGASLFRHPGGEDIAAITSRFPHWFVPSFTAYAGREDKLAVDQHQLLASIAPRRVYVCSAEDDAWADPVGEYLAVVAARPAFGADGIGYHVRPGGHDLIEEDWLQILDFVRR
ncbi:acetylxylan esterase [Kribbella sp. NPDC004875]|uniref:glucuronyl esterase domain-containing protein n=1 Tax=Kribbella sp. NPDC004875 TaxID=3364107 RepID=UPI0036B16D31